jgi:hypothetical protein
MDAATDWVGSQRGGALHLDGVNDYVSVAEHSLIPVGNQSFTIGAWLFADAMGNYGIVGWGNYGSSGQVTALRLLSHGGVDGIRMYWWANDITVDTGDISGVWRHVAATYDGTDRSIYLDGVLVGVDQPGTHYVPDSANFRIGSTNNGEFFNGRLGDVRLYDRALSANEVLATYVSGNDLYSPAVGTQERYYRANAPIGAIGTGLHAIEAGGIYGAPGINSGLHAIDTGVVTA